MWIPYFWNLEFVRVCSLDGRIFYNVYTVKSLKLYFPLVSRTIIYFHVYIISDFPITYRNASVLCQSEYTYLHKTENIFFKSNENTYPKGRALMQMYKCCCPSNEKREFLLCIYVLLENVELIGCSLSVGGPRECTFEGDPWRCDFPGGEESTSRVSDQFYSLNSFNTASHF